MMRTYYLNGRDRPRHQSLTIADKEVLLRLGNIAEVVSDSLSMQPLSPMVSRHPNCSVVYINQVRTSRETRREQRTHRSATEAKWKFSYLFGSPPFNRVETMNSRDEEGAAPRTHYEMHSITLCFKPCKYTYLIVGFLLSVTSRR